MQGTVVRVKSRRICYRFPWGFPDKCGAMFQQTPGESDTKPGEIRQFIVNLAVYSQNEKTHENWRKLTYRDISWHILTKTDRNWQNLIFPISHVVSLRQQARERGTADPVSEACTGGTPNRFQQQTKNYTIMAKALVMRRQLVSERYQRHHQGRSEQHQIRAGE